MDFFHSTFPSILQSIVIGSIFGICFIRISSIKNSFQYFKDTTIRFLQDDVKDLNRERYNKVSRDELMMQVNFLTQRILVIETEMKEREKIKSKS